MTNTIAQALKFAIQPKTVALSMSSSGWTAPLMLWSTLLLIVILKSLLFGWMWDMDFSPLVLIFTPITVLQTAVMPALIALILFKFTSHNILFIKHSIIWGWTSIIIALISMVVTIIELSLGASSFFFIEFFYLLYVFYLLSLGYSALTGANKILTFILSVVAWYAAQIATPFLLLPLMPGWNVLFLGSFL